MNSPTFNLTLLDASIDDIEDLAGFEVPIAGMYSLKIHTSVKVVKMVGKDTDCVEAAFEVIECLEQNDPNEHPTKPGTRFSVLFQLTNEISMGKMKELLMPIAIHFGERNLLNLITKTLVPSENVIICAKVKRRADKTDKEKFYPDISSVTVA